jgi:hypothetical protein
MKRLKNKKKRHLEDEKKMNKKKKKKKSRIFKFDAVSGKNAMMQTSRGADMYPTFCGLMVYLTLQTSL